MKRNFEMWRVFFCLSSALILASAGAAQAQGRSDDERPGPSEDRLEEKVGDDLIKVTHIFRHNRGKAASAPCACADAGSASYSLERVKWFDPSTSAVIYTVNSNVGSGAAAAVAASFGAWKTAGPASPSVALSQNDVSPGPDIALDGEQAISWRPLSSTYGANTLAVTVYWYTLSRIGGYSKVVHFDIAFNTDYVWANSAAADSCGGSGAFDIQNVGTHEAGHVLGLAHNRGCNLTMNPTAAEGETSKSTLAPGDINGIKKIYP